MQRRCALKQSFVPLRVVRVTSKRVAPTLAKLSSIASASHVPCPRSPLLCPRRPADAFYEWRLFEDGKQFYAIARQDGLPMRR